jgi:carbonic anhydrase
VVGDDGSVRESLLVLTKRLGFAAREFPAPMRFFSYKDPEENAREQIKKVRSHPWIAKEVPVRGFIFDADTGRLSEVKALEEERAA